MASLLLLARNPPVPRSLALVPSVSGFDPLKSQSSRGRRQDHQSSYAPGCSSLAVPLQPAVRGQSPTRVTSDPPTLHIMSACFGISVRWQEPLQQRILGRALVPWGDCEGALGSQNSQETEYWEQQQQQERQGAGRVSSPPPRCTTVSRAPNRMSGLGPCKGEEELLGLPTSSAPSSWPFPLSRVSQTSHCLPKPQLLSLPSQLSPSPIKTLKGLAPWTPSSLCPAFKKVWWTLPPG